MLPAANAALHTVGTSLAAGTEVAGGVGRGAGHGGGPGFILPLLLLVLVGFVVFKVTRRGRHAYAGGHGAMGTLSDRFARGEITREEFEYRRAVLNKEKDIPPAPRYTAPADQTSVGEPPAPDDGSSTD